MSKLIAFQASEIMIMEQIYFVFGLWKKYHTAASISLSALPCSV
jgi:hypothetical protein